MQHIRNRVKLLREVGYTDTHILAEICNRPTREQLADLKAAAGVPGVNTAKTMTNLIQGVLDE